MNSLYYVMYIAYLILMISLIFFDRKKPMHRFNWILFLVLLPGIGILLYFFSGSGRYIEYRSSKLLKRRGDSLKELEHIVQIKTEQYADKPVSEASKFHQIYGGSNYTVKNEVDFFINGASKFKHLFKDLRKAEDNIHVLYFTIHNDEIGQELVNILSEKARQGVEVKLLYDSVGCFATLGHPFSLLNRLKKAGGRVVPIRPHLFDINYRNHRKIVIIDGKIGYTGGMNIGSNYKDGYRGKKPWRDTHIRIVGSAVHCIQKIFLSDWLLSTSSKPPGFRNDYSHYFPDVEVTSNLGVQIVANGVYNKLMNNDIINLSYFNLISRARKKVWIQTPYFVPSEIILQTLKSLASLGVDVRIMTSGLYGVGGPFHFHIANFYFRHLVQSGVRIFKYNGIMHAKTILVDDNEVAIGTANLNIRSLEKDDELYAYIESDEFASIYEAMYRLDLKACTEIDYEQFNQQSLVSRACESVVSLFTPIA